MNIIHIALLLLSGFFIMFVMDVILLSFRSYKKYSKVLKH